jgi:hypothetical protein
MKENEAPEKIHIGIVPSSLNSYTYITCGKDFPNAVEYTRTNAFIEKACEWLKNSSYGYLTENWGEIELDRETLAVDFENYMKGE